MEVNMPKAKSLVNVTFGTTGETYEKGRTYDVPSGLLEKYPEYFKLRKSASNKQAETEENK
jgi:hypothetical protein